MICTPFTGHPVEGVLLCGTHMSTKMCIRDSHFPKNNLYRLMSTKPSEADAAV